MCNAEISKAGLFIAHFFHACSVGKPKMVLFASHQALLKGGEKGFLLMTSMEVLTTQTTMNHLQFVFVFVFLKAIAQTSLER